MLIGDALVNEHERLQTRVNALLDKIEAAMKQALRIAATQENLKPDADFGARRTFFAALLRRGALGTVRTQRFQSRTASPVASAMADALFCLPVPIRRTGSVKAVASYSPVIFGNERGRRGAPRILPTTRRLTND